MGKRGESKVHWYILFQVALKTVLFSSKSLCTTAEVQTDAAGEQGHSDASIVDYGKQRRSPA
jgi:hypothetical protein